MCLFFGGGTLPETNSSPLKILLVGSDVFPILKGCPFLGATRGTFVSFSGECMSSPISRRDGSHDIHTNP